MLLQKRSLRFVGRSAPRGRGRAGVWASPPAAVERRQKSPHCSKERMPGKEIRRRVVPSLLFHFRRSGLCSLLLVFSSLRRVTVYRKFLQCQESAFRQPARVCTGEAPAAKSWRRVRDYVRSSPQPSSEKLFAKGTGGTPVLRAGAGTEVEGPQGAGRRGNNGHVRPRAVGSQQFCPRPRCKDIRILNRHCFADPAQDVETESARRPGRISQRQLADGGGGDEREFRVGRPVGPSGIG